MLRYVALFTLFFTPLATSAGVVINEIAWMGSANTDDNKANAYYEWIELINTDINDVDLAGWVLAALDGKPSISLSGVIPGGGLYLLERNDDDTVPGIAADMTYGTRASQWALGNSGDVLILTDAGGNEIDRVDGSNNWAIGGNNETKETAQRTDGGWVTAKPTPRQANQVQSTVSDNSNTVQTKDPVIPETVPVEEQSVVSKESSMEVQKDQNKEPAQVSSEGPGGALPQESPVLLREQTPQEKEEVVAEEPSSVSKERENAEKKEVSLSSATSALQDSNTEDVAVEDVLTKTSEGLVASAGDAPLNTQREVGLAWWMLGVVFLVGLGGFAAFSLVKRGVSEADMYTIVEIADTDDESDKKG